MKSLFILILTGCFIIGINTLCYAQEQMEVDGAIRVENSNTETPEPGTIRFNPTTNDFEGWNGTHWLSLTAGKQYGEVTDVEGNVYRTIKIGTQEWMAENLRTPRYRNNQLVTLTQSNATWSTTTNGAYTWYDNDSDNEIPYGKLYNWYAVNDPRGLCPEGWEVPMDDEWDILRDYLDPSAVGNSNIAGGRMKEDVVYWDTPNVYASNESGFSGLPGGYRVESGAFGRIGRDGYWWSSTEDDANDAWYRELSYNSGNVIGRFYNKRRGLSVRCVRD